MHEYRLAKSVLDSIIEKTKPMVSLEKISSIKLKIGNLKMITPQSFKETFKQIAKGTLCEGASLEIEIVDGDTLLIENIEGEFKE